MFHRKVHPENSTAAHKHQNNESKKKTINSFKAEEEEDIMIIHPKRTFAKENNQHKSQSNPLQFSLGNDIEDSSENREHWIKTDSDCKLNIHSNRARPIVQFLNFEK